MEVNVCRLTESSYYKRALNLSTVPSGLYLTLKTHLHMIGFLPKERSTIIHVPAAMRSWSCLAIASFHQRACGPIIAS